jgi:DNA-binding NarL/FixJ family response regulator
LLTLALTEAGVGKNSPTDKGKTLAERANIEYIENIYTGDSTQGEQDVMRALLVDDHDLFRYALDVMLTRRAGFSENVQAGSLVEARQALMAQRNRLDCAVIDLDLCGGLGIELITELRGVYPDLPILALTTSPKPGWLSEASKAGANEVLTTAVSSDEIIKAVRRLVYI